ncbi:MAG TPA: hypothetical protein PLY87_22525 [Planctomycetaceae bacterium]|nr:hypothetical protein [Planctomycetaceae bacterium]
MADGVLAQSGAFELVPGLQPRNTLSGGSCLRGTFATCRAMLNSNEFVFLGIKIPSAERRVYRTSVAPPTGFLLGLRKNNESVAVEASRANGSRAGTLERVNRDGNKDA